MIKMTIYLIGLILITYMNEKAGASNIEVGIYAIIVMQGYILYELIQINKKHDKTK